MLGKQNERLKCESWYFQERRVSYNQRDVYDYTDCDEKSCERFEFVVGSKQVFYHFEECFCGMMLFADELMGRSCQNRPSVYAGHIDSQIIIKYHKHVEEITETILLLTGTTKILKYKIFLIIVCLIFIGMYCCSDQSKVQEKQPRNQFKQKVQSEPVKFKLLSLLGLKQYLIDKYVFSRYPPSYEFYEEDGEHKIKIDHDYTYSPYYKQEVKLIQNEHHSIHALSFNLRNRQLYQGTLIYSHGNSSDLSQSVGFISKFSACFPKFDYVVYDYTGYGRSSKKNVTQQSICQDLELLINSLNVQKSEIILWGFSLGCYPTVRVASKYQFKGVILQSPLSSIYSLFTDNLTPYSTFKNDCFSILQHIGKIQSFLFIIHSKADQIVPVEHSRILFQRHRMVSSNPFCFLVEVTALKHNHMHQLFGDKDSNSVRDVMHSYLKLMIQKKNLPKGTQLQIQKGKYLEDLGKHDLVQYVDMESKSIKQDNPGEINEVKQSINFSRIKENVTFEYDQITPQQTVSLNHYLHVSSTKHRNYFTVSREARDQTQVSQILGERNIQRLYD